MADENRAHVHSDLKCEYNTKTLHRIRRIKGQLNALERLIEADAGSCEERVIQARAIEKGMTSLITHLVECYLVNTARFKMVEDPDTATQEIARIFDLLNH
ncbi:MAG: metal-sensitive transcriptional regulator [Chloroflexi bacterium]|jgi:DNA-binding FrmR family transcriptional regulator|nr:metal-sensitive transcriptional regulator [Chloroflexota bacterium]